MPEPKIELTENEKRLLNTGDRDTRFAVLKTLRDRTGCSLYTARDIVLAYFEARSKAEHEAEHAQLRAMMQTFEWMYPQLMALLQKVEDTK
jgi:ribosomal protein L7/L12